MGGSNPPKSLPIFEDFTSLAFLKGDFPQQFPSLSKEGLGGGFEHKRGICPLHLTLDTLSDLLPEPKSTPLSLANEKRSFICSPSLQITFFRQGLRLFITKGHDIFSRKISETSRQALLRDSLSFKSNLENRHANLLQK